MGKPARSVSGILVFLKSLLPCACDSYHEAPWTFVRRRAGHECSSRPPPRTSRKDSLPGRDHAWLDTMRHACRSHATRGLLEVAEVAIRQEVFCLYRSSYVVWLWSVVTKELWSKPAPYAGMTQNAQFCYLDQLKMITTMCWTLTACQGLGQRLFMH